MAGGDEAILAIVAALILDRHCPPFEDESRVRKVEASVTQSVSSLLCIEADTSQLVYHDN